MKARQQQISITIDIVEGNTLRNQILKLAGNTLNIEYGTPLYELMKLLSSNFSDSHKDVNFIEK